MSAVLRASGTDFAVDEFLASSKLTAINVYRKGEPRFPKSKPGGRKNERSGVNIGTGDADMSDFDMQIEQVNTFLRNFADDIKMLRDFPGVEGLSLDFGVESKPPFWSSYRFPSNLIKVAGDIGIDLELSVYPCDDEDEGPAEQVMAHQPA